MNTPLRAAVGDGDPYEVLAALGLGYHSTMAEIHRRCQKAQGQKLMTEARRKAWAELCNAERRLQLDFFHLQTDPTVFGEVAPEPAILPEPAPPTWLPPVPNPTAEEIAQAVGKVDPGPLPSLPAPGEPPPLQPDLWALLHEAWEDAKPVREPLPAPVTFLEDEP